MSSCNSFKACTVLVAFIWISSLAFAVIVLSSMAFPNAISLLDIPVCFAATIAASPPVIFWLTEYVPDCTFKNNAVEVAFRTVALNPPDYEIVVPSS